MLPPITKRKGYSPCYSFGDMLALELVNILVHRFQLRVQAITPVSRQLFDMCERAILVSDRSPLLVICLPIGALKFVEGEILADQLSEPAIVLPLRPVIEELNGRLLRELGAVNQLALSLAPVGLKSKGGSHERAA